MSDQKESSFFDDVLDVVGTVAPGICAALGVPGWAVLGVKAIGQAILGKDDATEEEVAAAVKNATPEQLLALRDADYKFQADMKKLEIDIFQLRVNQEQNFLLDVQDARKSFSENDRVFWLGIIVLSVFAAVMGLSMYGSYVILTNGLTIKDPGIIAAVFGFLGTVVGYVASNAQQVVGFFFGSSMGSSQKSDAMASAFGNLSSAFGKKV